jgi:hypothetical protein
MTQCVRIAYFMLVVYRCELVRMEAEFQRDDNGKVWFTFASKILVRPVLSLNEYDEELVLHSVSLLRTKPAIEAQAEQIAAELSINDDYCTEKSRQIAQDMSDYYEEIKEKAGINKLLADDPTDHVTNSVFARLRPKSPYTFD